MMYCPKCRTEYVEQVSMCADCEIALVTVLPDINKKFNLIGDLKNENYKVQYRDIINKSKYKTFRLRLGASILDGLILSPLSIVGTLILFKTQNVPNLVFQAYNLLMVVLGYSYNIYFIGKYGQTLGKMYFGLKVKDSSNESPIGYQQALKRDIVPILWILLVTPYQMAIAPPFIIQNGDLVENSDIFLHAQIFIIYGWVVLEMFTMLFNKRRRAIHDFIAGTVVIRTPENVIKEQLRKNLPFSRRAFRAVIRIIIGAIFLVMLIGMGIMLALNMPIGGRILALKQCLAATEMKMIQTGLQMYFKDNGRYPDMVQGLDALIEMPTQGEMPKNYNRAGYLKGKGIRKDPWSNEYVYKPSKNNMRYQLICFGADGKEGGVAGDSDIILSDEGLLVNDKTLEGSLKECLEKKNNE